MSENDLDQAMQASSAPSFFHKLSKVGDKVSGTVVSAELRQMNKFKNNQPTNEPDAWDDGKPKTQVQVVIQTSLRESDDDDGRRSIYIKTWGAQKRAWVEAVRAAGYTTTSQALAVGNGFSAAYVGEEAGDAPSPTKLFKYEVIKASISAMDEATSAPEQPAQAQSSAPAGETPADKAKQLIQLGLDDATVAKTTGLPVDAVAALRETVADGVPF